MSTRKTKSVTISLPPQMLDELDRVRKREHRTRSELLREALRRYITVAERSHIIPVAEALPEEIEAMRRADEEYARGECVRLEDLQNELGLKSSHGYTPHPGPLPASGERGKLWGSLAPQERGEG